MITRQNRVSDALGIDEAEYEEIYRELYPKIIRAFYGREKFTETAKALNDILSEYAQRPIPLNTEVSVFFVIIAQLVHDLTMSAMTSTKEMVAEMFWKAIMYEEGIL